MAFEAEKAYLQKQGVYEHLSKIVDRVIAEKPTDAYGLVEVLSRLVKQPAKASPPTEEDSAAYIEALKVDATKAQALDKVPMSEENEPIAVPCAVPDFIEEAEMFSWTGVGLGEAESYKVMCSLRNMAAKRDGYTKVRFWGKILGTDADYYIAEGTGGDGGEVEEGEEMDAPGTGVNTCTYFATTDLAGEWIQLPHVKPSEIVAASMIKRHFTGNPKAQVITHPFFDGKEEVYLRAQIARISAETVLCPKGAFIREDPEEPNSSVIPNEEFAMPQPADLFKQEAWIHMVPYILNNGRTAHKELEPPDEDGDKAAYVAALEEQESDPLKDQLRGITEEASSWVVKQAGDSALYKSPIDGKPKCNAVTFVRSLVWPGAMCASQKGNYSNLYIGYGMKAGQPDFFPPAPPDVQDEPEDPGEEEEPQGTEEQPEELAEE